MMKAFLPVAALLLPLSTFAHHGWSEYDAQQVLTLDGTVLESGYDNPHTVIRLKAGDKTWVAVLAPPFRMEARGLKAEAIRVGVKARVVGYQNRSKADELRVERIIIDGKTTELR